MHLAFLRDYHEALVIALARTVPEVERGTVAELTRLTPQAVSKVLARLVDEGVIAQTGVRRPAIGKPAAVYRLVPESRWAIGVHVTRRALRVALTDLAGTVGATASTPLPPDFTPDQLLTQLTAAVNHMIAEHRLAVPTPLTRAEPPPSPLFPAEPSAGPRPSAESSPSSLSAVDLPTPLPRAGSAASSPSPVELPGRRRLGDRRPGDGAGRRLIGVGIGMIGPLDQATGTVRDSHGLRHWHDVPLADLATRALGMPVLVDKDVTAGVTAEAWRRGAGFRDAALIMVEAGVGAGLWLGGATHRGAHTNAGEFGHTVVQLGGPLCVCGRHGCLEAVLAQAPDPAAAAAVLAVGVVNLLQTLDLGHVVLAGADLLQHGETYLRAVEQAVRTQVPRADWLTVEVALTSLGTEVIAAGAAMQVLNARYGLPDPAGLAARPQLAASR